MKGIGRLFQSSIGIKTIMAITGAGLIVFVFFHMAGNLQIYLGQQAYNRYAQALQELGPLLWLARAGLLLFFAVHIILAVKLQRMNATARPIRYVHDQQRLKTSTAATTMWLTGLVILAFVVYHLLHFSFGVVQPEYFRTEPGTQRHDVYHMVVKGFQNPLVSGSYIVAQLFLGMHLLHAGGSLFQTLGVNHPRYQRTVNRIALFIALVVVLGNVSIPLAILLGLVGPVTGG